MKINLIMESRELGGSPDIKAITAIKKTNGDSFSYKFIDEFGKTSIEIFKNSAIISREGSVKCSMILKKGINTNFDYVSEYINTSFELFTKELNISERGIKAVYVMYQNGNLINEINLSVYEK
ncbi:DUF1934 family protein [Fusobacterium sp.]|uniref:DUF1934 family protein n=1 Tax=Fusobacterium sp. TaxID=68766 RepID=UPI00261B7C48|nr:DUF1934 family protein [Fusobacterium sp.]